MGFSLKFSKTYKNPVKSTKSTLGESNKHTKNNVKNNEQLTLDSLNVTEFDGKPLKPIKTKDSKSEIIIESQPNSNKLYERLRMDGNVDEVTNLPPSNKSYTREDYLNEVKILPSASKITDYEHMPITDFGKAMLRGMGWREGTPIGLTNKGLVEPIEYIPRTKGLGLGAQSRSEFLNDSKLSSTTKLNNPKKSTYRYISEGNKKEKERIVEYGLIKFGAWNDSYVRIVKTVMESNSYIVQFINDRDKIETIHSKNLIKVTKDEALANSVSVEKPSSLHLENWILPQLYVRIISKSFKGGKYYRHKAQILKVNPDKRCCDLITDESIKLRDVNESYLQTIIPKNEDGLVVVLCGDYRNKKGHVVSIQNNMASVNFQDDDSMKALPLDHICQIFPH